MIQNSKNNSERKGRWIIPTLAGLVLSLGSLELSEKIPRNPNGGSYEERMNITLLYEDARNISKVAGGSGLFLSGSFALLGLSYDLTRKKSYQNP